MTAPRLAIKDVWSVQCDFGRKKPTLYPLDDAVFLMLFVEFVFLIPMYSFLGGIVYKYCGMSLWWLFCK